jgi:GNAT superfamily N-acetyltransferase
MPNDLKTLSERIARGEQPEYADFPDEYILQGHDSGDLFWIDWFHIPKEVRGKGHGRAFYQAIERWVRDGEVVTKQIRIMAADSGNGPTDEFWIKMGFEHISENSEDYEQSHMMRKTLKTKKVPV